MGVEKPERQEHWNDWIAKKTVTGKPERTEKPERQEWSLRQYIGAAPYANRAMRTELHFTNYVSRIFFLVQPALNRVAYCYR